MSHETCTKRSYFCVNCVLNQPLWHKLWCFWYILGYDVASKKGLFDTIHLTCVIWHQYKRIKLYVKSIILTQNMMVCIYWTTPHIIWDVSKGHDFLIGVSRNESKGSTDLGGNFPPNAAFSMGMAEHLTLSITVPANIYHRRSKQKHC